MICLINFVIINSSTETQFHLLALAQCGKRLLNPGPKIVLAAPLRDVMASILIEKTSLSTNRHNVEYINLCFQNFKTAEVQKSFLCDKSAKSYFLENRRSNFYTHYPTK